MNSCSFYCRICNKYIPQINYYTTLLNQYRINRTFFCDNCENNGWRRCIVCWKMTIVDEAPQFIIRCSYCINKNNLISYMAF